MPLGEQCSVVTVGRQTLTDDSASKAVECQHLEFTLPATKLQRYLPPRMTHASRYLYVQSRPSLSQVATSSAPSCENQRSENRVSKPLRKLLAQHADTYLHRLILSVLSCVSSALHRAQHLLLDAWYILPPRTSFTGSNLEKMAISSVSPSPSIEGQLTSRQIEADLRTLSSCTSELPGEKAPTEYAEPTVSLDDSSSTSSSTPFQRGSLRDLENTTLPKPRSSPLQDEGDSTSRFNVNSNHTKDVSTPAHLPKSHLTAVYCTELHTQGSAGNLSHKFSKLPGYLSVHMPMRDAKNSRGYSHVHFKDMESAKAAIDALQKQRFHKRVLKMRLSPPLCADQVRKIKQGAKALEENHTPFSRIDKAAMKDDRRAKEIFIRDDNDRARWEPGYIALSENLHLSSDMGNLCELLNKELRSLEVAYPKDTEARRNFRVWENQFRKIQELSEILEDSRSQFLHFKDFKPSETDDKPKRKARDEVLTAMHRLAERAGNRATFIEVFSDVKYGPSAKYETSFEWKGRKARQEIVHHFFGALEGSMRWRFIHEVYLEAIPLILKDMTAFEKLVRSGYAELFSLYGELREGELGEADMDLENSDDE
ncbi:hypothetical protein DL98DRAFT_534539 [Cadophora sp. DSE1049]|nr:hypothetical protein DL98DRAFT_534539 [Cadophora sp. DSE1049]